MLDQPAAGLHQPLLQADRPVLDLPRQHRAQRVPPARGFPTIGMGWFRISVPSQLPATPRCWSPARVAGCAHSRATRYRCASGSPGSSVLLNDRAWLAT
jgi:hypothetical protein